MGIQLIPRNKIFQIEPIQGGQDMPSYTYFIDFERGYAQGMTDTTEAMQQAIYKCLQTHWLAHAIYDERYGFEAAGLLGQDRSFVESEIKRRIREALVMDERIDSVGQFQFFAGEKQDALAISFCVKTIFGMIDERMEVALT